MMRFVFVFFLVLVVSFPATAQQKKCFRLVNETNEKVMGTIATAPQDATPSQRMNFTLTPEGDTKALKVCSDGPFFAGDRLRLVLRTVVPVFECKTAVSGDVVVERIPDKAGTGTKLSARCR